MKGIDCLRRQRRKESEKMYLLNISQLRRYPLDENNTKILYYLFYCILFIFQITVCAVLKTILKIFTFNLN
jgi:hypothetical protein